MGGGKTSQNLNQWHTPNNVNCSFFKYFIKCIYTMCWFMDFIMIIFHHFLRPVSDAYTFQFWSRVRDSIRCYIGKSVGQSMSVHRSVRVTEFFLIHIFLQFFLAKFNINEIERTTILRYMKPYSKPFYCNKMANWSINLTICFKNYLFWYFQEP